MSDIKNKAEFIFEKVKKENASADLIVDCEQSLSLKANQGELEEYKVSSTQIFGLRLIKDNKVGTAYSEADDEDALAAIVQQALTNASYSKEEVHEKILDNKQNLRTDDALLCPVDDASIDDKIKFVLEMESDLLSRDKIQNVPYNALSESLSERYVFSTAGLDAYSKQKAASAYAYGLAVDGDKNAMEGLGQLARVKNDLNAKNLVEDVYKECMAMLAGTPVSSKRYDVIFDQECQSSLFGVFSMALSGKSAKDGINPWRNKLGEQVCDERLQMSDQPLLVDGFGYELFDAEGTSCGDTHIIENGVLKTLLHNSVSASHFGVASTGHGQRGPKSTLAVSPHQIVIHAGSDDDSQLKSGEYLELTGLTGIHSGASAVSGDFSFGASGYLCKDGERQRSVRGITVAGNFYEMLKNINGIGNQQHWNWQKSSLMPSIRFTELAISGE